MHPHVRLDLVVSDAPVDIVADGYDAGIQLGEVIDKDMIAVPVTGDLRLAVVGAPSVLRAAGSAEAPARLDAARLPQLASDGDTPPYRWEFTENGRDFSVTVPTRVLSTHSVLNRRLAIAGLG